MTRHIVAAGMISAVISSGLAGTICAEPLKDAVLLVADSSKQGSGLGSTEPTTTPTDKRTDLTGGQSGTPTNDYAGTPVQQGKLQEVTDSAWNTR
jgi:hypothetical protein